MRLSDKKEPSHSQLVTRSVAKSFKEKDTFEKATESTMFRVVATEFGKSGSSSE